MFCLAAALAAIGGAMFTLQVGFMSPSFVGIVPSIEMVIFAAVGGRMSLVGAVWGTLLVNAGKTLLLGELSGPVAVPDGGASSSAWWWRFPTGWQGSTPQILRPCAAAPPSRLCAEPLPAKTASTGRHTIRASTDFMLAVEDLTVSFDGFKAIDNLTLYVRPRRARASSSARTAPGKTTLLDLICGKTRASGGSIKFRNREMTGLPEYQIVRPGVGRKFQTPSIYENLTVLENLGGRRSPAAAACWCADLSHHRRRSASVWPMWPRRSRLDDVLEREAAQLSHGQKQWLEIGMLLMQDPQLLMLDEPIAGMSVRERELTADLLKRISKGRAVIVIEHDMDFVQRIADKVTVMHQGRILAEGRWPRCRTTRA